jgi:hypothetical protein
MANDEPTQERIYVFVGSTDSEILMTSTEAVALYTDMKANRFKNPYRVGCFDSIWMMHVAVNLYNEDGLFADTFPLIDTMSNAGELYSVFGRKFDSNDYLRPDGR